MVTDVYLVLLGMWFKNRHTKSIQIYTHTYSEIPMVLASCFLFELSTWINKKYSKYIFYTEKENNYFSFVLPDIYRFDNMTIH